MLLAECTETQIIWLKWCSGTQTVEITIGLIKTQENIDDLKNNICLGFPTDIYTTFLSNKNRCAVIHKNTVHSIKNIFNHMTPKLFFLSQIIIIIYHIIVPNFSALISQLHCVFSQSLDIHKEDKGQKINPHGMLLYNIKTF